MLMTANPCADAERWANKQDLLAAQAEAMEIKAYDIALAAISSKQASWYKAHDVGDMLLTPDESLSDAIGNDDEVTDAFAELMTDPAPAAHKLRQALASYIAKHNWRDITGGQSAV